MLTIHFFIYIFRFFIFPIRRRKVAARTIKVDRNDRALFEFDIFPVLVNLETFATRHN
jgi:hypothetical protein